MVLSVEDLVIYFTSGLPPVICIRTISIAGNHLIAAHQSNFLAVPCRPSHRCRLQMACNPLH